MRATERRKRNGVYGREIKKHEQRDGRRRHRGEEARETRTMATCKETVNENCNDDNGDGNGDGGGVSRYHASDCYLHYIKYNNRFVIGQAFPGYD